MTLPTTPESGEGQIDDMIMSDYEDAVGDSQYDTIISEDELSGELED